MCETTSGTNGPPVAQCTSLSWCSACLQVAVVAYHNAAMGIVVTMRLWALELTFVCVWGGGGRGGGGAQTPAHGRGLGLWQQWPKTVPYPMGLGTGLTDRVSHGVGHCLGPTKKSPCVSFNYSLPLHWCA